MNINSREEISNLNIKIKNEFSKISVNSKSSYKNAKNKYKDYEKLIIERDKTLEILKILQKQEKYDVPIDFSCDEVDILKLENKIKFYENSYYKLLDDNLDNNSLVPPLLLKLFYPFYKKITFKNIDNILNENL